MMHLFYCQQRLHQQRPVLLATENRVSSLLLSQRRCLWDSKMIPSCIKTSNKALNTPVLFQFGFSFLQRARRNARIASAVLATAIPSVSLSASEQGMGHSE